MHYDKDVVKNQLTLDQVAEVLVSLGGAQPWMKSGMFMAENICHNLPGESGDFKLYYYDNTKLFRCYTECREAFDIFQLVQKVQQTQYNDEWSLPRAVVYVAQMFGIAGEMEGFEGDKVDDWKMINHYNALLDKIERSEAKGPISLEFYECDILERLSFVPIESWIKEGITLPTLAKYGIKYYPKDHKIVIPHWDDCSNLIGIRGRTLIKREAEWFGKYMPIKINGIMYNHPLSFALYGLNFNKSNIKKAKKAIIFEGEKSVLLYESLFGAENNIAVASCGSSISAHQFELLKALDIEELVIAFDRQFKEIGDKEFELHIKSLKQLANKFNNYVTVSVIHDKDGRLGYKDSPIDCGKATFEALFKERIII
jgi:hypothetical protein